jgi:hypothetical protein
VPAEPLLETLDALEGFAGGLRILDGDAVSFFDADGQLQSVNGIEAEAAGAEEDGVELDFLGRDAEHAVFNEELAEVIERRGGHE